MEQEKNYYGKKLRPQKNFFEKNAWLHGMQVCGIDEVGRGSLAGPLVVCAAILPQNTQFSLLKDSKVLSPQKRETAYKWLTKHCLHAEAFISIETIDTINIYQATILGMRRAFCALLTKLQPNPPLKYIVTDAMPLATPQCILTTNTEVHSYTKAESLSMSVAAASIIAKVSRDRFMNQLEKHLPQYTFATHKGYGTASHLEEIANAGMISLLHRKTFLQKALKTKKVNREQQTIF